jgi:hypothetical protein
MLSIAYTRFPNGAVYTGNWQCSFPLGRSPFDKYCWAGRQQLFSRSTQLKHVFIIDIMRNTAEERVL